MSDESTQQLGEGEPEPTPDPPDPPATPEPVDKPHRLARRPRNTNGHYMVLAGTPSGDVVAYRELGYYKAHGSEQAKRLAVADAQAGHDDWLKRAIASDHGAILHPVPAMNWPKTEPTKYKVEKALVIG